MSKPVSIQYLGRLSARGGQILEIRIRRRSERRSYVVGIEFERVVSYDTAVINAGATRQLWYYFRKEWRKLVGTRQQKHVAALLRQLDMREPHFARPEKTGLRPDGSVDPESGATYIKIDWLRRCGKSLECGSRCCLAFRHIVPCECVGDDPGYPGTCPA